MVSTGLQRGLRRGTGKGLGNPKVPTPGSVGQPFTHGSHEQNEKGYVWETQRQEYDCPPVTTSDN